MRGHVVFCVFGLKGFPMKKKDGRIFLVLAAAALSLCVADALAQSGGATGTISAPVRDIDPLGVDKPREEIKPITDALPIWGKRARERGFELPLPFGSGALFTYMEQGVNIDNIDVSFQGAPVSGMQVSEADSRDTNVSFRGDFWLFPFMDLYGVVGYVDGKAKFAIQGSGLEIGGTPIPDFDIQNEMDYTGTTYGGGATLAAGYKYFFGLLDVNYTLSDLDIADSDVKTITASPRFGLLLESRAKGQGVLYVGAMYIEFDQSLRGSISLADIDPQLGQLVGDVPMEYSVDFTAKEALNFLFGGSWDINKRWSLQAEVGGLANRKQITTGGMFRF
jgi:hypothetical protein